MKKLSFIISLVVISLSSAATAHAQNWGVAVNAADMLDLGTISVEGSYAVGRHWSVNASAEVNPWTFRHGEDNQFQDRRQTYAAGVRWWPWNVYSGWWFAMKGQYQEYNRGGLVDDQTREGDRFGLGVNGGYSLMLSEHVNLDFGIGFWGGYDMYTTYACPSCGKIVDEGKQWFFLPNEIMIALMWTF